MPFSRARLRCRVPEPQCAVVTRSIQGDRGYLWSRLRHYDGVNDGRVAGESGRNISRTHVRLCGLQREVVCWLYR